MASDKSRLLVRCGWHVEVYLRLSGRDEGKRGEVGSGGGMAEDRSQCLAFK